MYYIGLMSGTSMDAIDVVLVDINGQSLGVIAYEQFEIQDDIQNRVRTIDASSSIEKVSELDSLLGGLFADAICSLIRDSGIEASDISAIGSHGQTVLHLPGGSTSRTLQIGDANIIATKTGITTVADFRRMDMAAGGQGAPLAPGFHAWYFGPGQTRQVVLNIGGMANLTVLCKEHITGFDSGPGNALMDDWTRLHRGIAFDTDGQWASSGHCHAGLLQLMLDYHYLAKNPPKSTGKDEFNLRWLQGFIDRCHKTPTAVDVQATLLEFTAATITSAIRQQARNAEEIVVCGGGCHNTALMTRLETLLADKVVCSTDKYGIDPDAVEAIAFAWLARQRLECLPGNLPSVTGAKQAVILGGIYESSARPG